MRGRASPEPNIGDRFGSFVVISKIYKRRRAKYVNIRCDCGNIVSIVSHTINKVTQCLTCTRKSERTMTFNPGDKHGSLTLIEELPKIKGERNLKVRASCDCGRTVIMNWGAFKNNKTCGQCKFKKERHTDCKNGKFIGRHYFLAIKKRAQKKSWDFNLSVEFMDNLLALQNFKCALTGLPISGTMEKSGGTASLDRIDSSKGYVVGNVQWVHRTINMMKWKLKQIDFIEFCRLVTESYNNNTICWFSHSKLSLFVCA